MSGTHRKTVSVKHVIETANHMLLHSPNDGQDGRESIQVLVGQLLHDTGNYDGFRYLTAEDMSASKNGIAASDFDIDDAIDGTRIRFFINRRLT